MKENGSVICNEVLVIFSCFKFDSKIMRIIKFEC